MNLKNQQSFHMLFYSILIVHNSITIQDNLNLINEKRTKLGYYGNVYSSDV